ncbi:O-glucosyltransferase rumi [Sesamum alatum]|uniref:O-glucosyltransferase rumi n=1 Tax=Sesamum alatum TaxID=300844 RepID=A0AAE1XV65_9LAMI|nr:O-glucosyltransferase rumi [Sesamum alatum]
MLDRHQTRRAQSTVACFLAVTVLVALITRWFDLSISTGLLQRTLHLQDSPLLYSSEFDCSLNCSDIALPTSEISDPSAPACPEYFRWIHEDLKPWKESGITREMVEKAKNLSHIRITIVNGRLYTQKFKEVYETRDVVTIWGLLQLLRLYPGRIPDLDFMFACNDRTVVPKRDYSSPNASIPPPVFHYCGEETSYDIVFPDWSFWGWPEVNIKPWEEQKEELKEATERIKWKDREPYAFWKGNTKLGPARRDLVTCNVSNGQDWKARIFDMEWSKEKKKGFNTSNLSSQCTYSQKYILACDSMTLVVKPHYYDFFSRNLVPTIHYWPIKEQNKCSAIKFAAQEIGKAGSQFVQEQLKMQNIYDYCFHVLNEYAKLLKYKPTVPEGSVETCSETLICSVKGQKRRFRKHSMVKNPSDTLPCALPDPYDPAELRAFIEEKENLKRKVILWESSQTTT